MKYTKFRVQIIVTCLFIIQLCKSQTVNVMISIRGVIHYYSDSPIREVIQKQLESDG